jgi:hypothetical protein
VLYRLAMGDVFEWWNNLPEQTQQALLVDPTGAVPVEYANTVRASGGTVLDDAWEEEQNGQTFLRPPYSTMVALEAARKTWRAANDAYEDAVRADTDTSSDESVAGRELLTNLDQAQEDAHEYLCRASEALAAARNGPRPSLPLSR